MSAKRSQVITAQDRTTRAGMVEGVIFPVATADEKIVVQLRIIGVKPSDGEIFDAVTRQRKLFARVWRRSRGQTKLPSSPEVA